MRRTIVRPTTEQIPLNIPREYVSKEIEITFFPLEELNAERGTQFKKTMKDFWAVLSDADAARLRKHVAKSREEWERNI